jgi:hypothetical protein
MEREDLVELKKRLHVMRHSVGRNTGHAEYHKDEGCQKNADETMKRFSSCLIGTFSRCDLLFLYTRFAVVENVPADKP